MEDSKFVMYDENGIERNAKILFEISANDKNYVVIALEMEDDMDSIYVSRLKDNGTDVEIVPIEDEEERKMIIASVKEKINQLSE